MIQSGYISCGQGPSGASAGCSLLSLMNANAAQADSASPTQPTPGGLLSESEALPNKNKLETLKSNSNYLREPLATELRNAENHFTNAAIQVLKFHGSYQQDNRDHRAKGQEKEWGMMLRLRSPAGCVPAQLYLALDRLADRYGNGTLRITTRQAFQLHGIPKQDLQSVVGTIVRNMGSTLAACGDVNRNVMAPAAPFATGGYPVARRLAGEIADLLAPQAAMGAYLDLFVNGEKRYRIRPNPKVSRIRRHHATAAVFSGDHSEPLYGSRYLPRKFKVGVTVPGDNSIDLLTQDLGLVAFTDHGGRLRGANVYVGGGMGRTHNNEETFARLADPLGYVKGRDVLDLVKAIVAIQRDHGDRRTRRHARLKYLVHDRGVSWLRSCLSTYFNGEIQPLRKEPKPQLLDYLGWQRQGDGLWCLGLPVMTGRLGGDLKSTLRALVERYQLELRLTPNQDMILCNIAASQKADINQQLETVGIHQPASPPRLERHGIACPALPSCGLAITESERVFPHLLKRLDQLLDRLGISQPLLVRMTGCPNGCARPYMAELGLVGSGPGCYQLWLGGTPGLTTLARPVLDRLPLADLETVIAPLLRHWARTAPRKSLGAFCQAYTVEELRSLLGTP